MTDRTAIQVGDLVQIVRPMRCCGSPHGIGYAFRVDVIDKDQPNDSGCYICGKKTTELVAWQKSGAWRTALYRLKRIPPLDELEGQRTEENLKEPA